MSLDFTRLRQEFPLLARKTYLNSGSYGALAIAVKTAVEAYLQDRLIFGANWETWTLRNESVREHVARLLRASYHFYNNEDDIETLVASMKQLQRQFQ